MKTQEFKEKLKQVIKDSFGQIENKKEVFELGLYTDSDISTLGFSYNTYNHFANQLKEEFLIEKQILSYYRWSIPEWYAEMNEEDKLRDEINDDLLVLREKLLSIDYENFSDIILDLFTQALIESRAEGAFNEFNEDIILYIDEPDGGINEKMKERIRQLIGEKYYEEFLFDMRNDF